MNIKSLVKLLKKAERETPVVLAETRFFVDPNRWSTAVRSWVREFQQHRRGESLPAFDGLFKDAFRSRSRTP
jgi:hypothetical protein